MSQPPELDAFLDRVLQFLGASRRFVAGAAIDDGDRFGAHAQGDAGGIHRCIARADYGYALSHADRRS